MELQRSRLFLLISLFVVGFALFSAWQQEHNIPEKSAVTEPGAPASPSGNDIPNLPVQTPITPSSIPVTTSDVDLIEVNTDVLKVKIDPHGGDVVRAELIQYQQTLHSPEGVLLLDKSSKRNYTAQTGLIGKDEQGPDSHQLGRARYQTTQTQYQLDGQENLRVDLLWHNNEGIKVTKSFLFKRGNYLVDISYLVSNPTDKPWAGNFYGQLRREFAEESKGFFGVQMYQGGAISTPNKPYKKISFKDMEKAPLREQVEGGWAAMLERYFLSAWIPAKNTNNHYYTRVDDKDVYNIGEVTPIVVEPKSEQTIGGQLYIGPEVAETLKQIAPGLNLTVDYGILWPISQLIFWLLKSIHTYVGNWGWSIILVTLIIKVLFYKLSATSYRSMGKMRQLQPRIELLKERHKDDKQQFSAALMELYRKEKMNPLGGCLPIIIQIPVFIALYYVLLESVELRHAPFMFWIQDLSSKDPYYVLPLIMGATMFIQQRMNPAPPDPIQAKIMMLMPIFFTALFLSFPAGLVLYWTVNNILSILQQWFITRSIGNEGTANKKWPRTQ